MCPGLKSFFIEMKEFSIPRLLAIFVCFLAIISASTETKIDDIKNAIEPESDVVIQFGSFGIDQNDEAEPVKSEAEPVEEDKNSFMKAIFAPVSDDQLKTLNNVDKTQTNRFLQSNLIPARLSLRFGRDHNSGGIGNYCTRILFICGNYLELPSKMRDNEVTKKNFLNAMFNSKNIPSILAKVSNSLLHPICYDAMKLLGDSLDLEQIDWLVNNVPHAISDNFELLISLKDYSFMNDKVAMKLSESRIFPGIDFLSIPNFVKTAPASTFFRYARVYYEGNKHFNIVIKNRENLLEEIASVRNIPHMYPLLVNFVNVPNMPTDYSFNPALIIESIKQFGLDPLSLASLMAYLQESDYLIMSNMVNIATIWADLHKNSHLPPVDGNHFTAINKEFNERIYEPLNNLIYLREKRDNINLLIDMLEEKQVNVYKNIVELVPDWLNHLKLLAQVPFHSMMRLSFKTRFSPASQASINPEDASNIIQLPRLATNQSVHVGFVLEANPAYIYSPFLWNSLWRNIFYTSGEDWRQDPEIMKHFVSGFSNFETLMKSRYEPMYRDSSCAKADTVNMLEAWQKLSIVLDHDFQSGPRYCRFIASLSIPAPPESVKLSSADDTERKAFAGMVELALKEIVMYDPRNLMIIKGNLSDQPTIVEYIEKRLSLQESSLNSHFLSPYDINMLEKICADWTTLVQNRQLDSSPQNLHLSLKMIESGFASLGKTLSDSQIDFIGSSPEIVIFLVYHGRALSRSQISGLLRSEKGKTLLRENKPFSCALMDYSEFSLGDFDSLGLKLEDIHLNAATIQQDVKLMLLTKQGFSSVADPIALVHLLGASFWKDEKLVKNLSIWELLNPLVLAYDMTFATDFPLINHMTGMTEKLHSKLLLNVALKFLIKWLIAQDWYAFQFHVVYHMGPSKFGHNYITNLGQMYAKYAIEGEIPARKAIWTYLRNIDSARGAENKSIVDSLLGLSVAVKVYPWSPFRAGVNVSGSPYANLLALPFETSGVHYPLINNFIIEYIRDNFKGDEALIWQARVEILSNFAADETGLVRYANEPRNVTRQRFNALKNLDACVYRWALESEGVDVESIFRDESNVNGNLFIESKNRPSIIPPIAIATMVKSAGSTRSDSASMDIARPLFGDMVEEEKAESGNKKSKKDTKKNKKKK